MNVIREPQPGEKLNSTWGRDVVRALKELRIVGGPGQRVTRGPNGTTIASIGGRSGTSALNENHPFKLSVRKVVSGSGSSMTATYYGVVMCNDGAVQMDDYAAFCDNTAATGMENGWKDIAFDFSGRSGAQVTYDLANAAIGMEEAGEAADVFVFVFHKDNDGTDEIHYRVQFDNEWDSSIDEGDRIGLYYVGTYNCASDDPYIFTVQNQVMKSALVVGEDSQSADKAPVPFELKIEDDLGPSGEVTGHTVVCNMPAVSIDGEYCELDNAEYGATGSGWYIPVIETTGETAPVNAYIDRVAKPPRLFLTDAATGPTGYCDMLEVGIVRSINGEWASVDEQYLLGIQHLEPAVKPFTVRCINTGTAAAPDWKYIIYIPDDAVQHGGYSIGSTYVVNECVPYGNNWFYVGEEADGDSKIRLNCRLYYYQNTDGSDKTIFFVRFNVKNKKSAPNAPSVTGKTTISKNVYLNLAEETDDGKILQYVSNAVNFNMSEFYDYSTSGGSSGGTQVNISYSQFAATGNIVTYYITGSTGVNLIYHDDIDASAVTISGDAEVSIDDYLIGNTTGPDGYGVNINSKNFEDECLVEKAPTGEESNPWVGAGTRAARDDHHHLISHLVNENDIALSEATGDGEDSGHYIVSQWLKDCGIIFDNSGVGPSGESDIPDDDQLVTFGDITEGVTGTMGATGVNTDNISSDVPSSEDNLLTEADLEDKNIWQGEWVRDNDTGGVGCEIMINCGILTIFDLAYHVYRKLTIDRYGMIRKVSKAKFAVFDNLTG